MLCNKQSPWTSQGQRAKNFWLPAAMEERTSLIQRGDKPPWYKRRRVIIPIAVFAVFAFVVILVVATVVPIATKSMRKCVFSTAYECFFNKQPGPLCLWCYNSNGIGECKEPPAHGGYPLTCSIGLPFTCMAYGFATGENHDSCVSFTPPNYTETCKWNNIYGNCYYDFEGQGPIGCCWNPT